MNVLEISGLEKHYPRVHAVRGIHFSVPKGSVYGILGPNGSGKTTTLGMVLGVIRPTAGSYSWHLGGMAGPSAAAEPETAEIRKRMGSLLETPNFYPYLTGRKNLEIVAEIKQVSYADIDRVLELAGLADRQHSKFKTYSLGMKQRLALASTLLGDPEVLVLDEPTNGLDPKGIAEVRDLIRQQAQAGKTILLASHMMDEVEKVCTHIAVLKKGELLAAGSMSELVSGAETIEISADDMPLLLARLRSLPQLDILKATSEIVTVVLREGLSKADLNRQLYEAGILLTRFAAQKRSLESKFLEITD
ncbi:MAG: ABC transporter ATP-binding protein [Bacteroidetes bacterium]|nr:ABC transporter ATP-binding protein [Bacteroidota bacterium]